MCSDVPKESCQAAWAAAGTYSAIVFFWLDPVKSGQNFEDLDWF